jgi:hypothetical protein
MATSSEQIEVYVHAQAEMHKVIGLVRDLMVEEQENMAERPFIRVRLGTVTEAVRRLNAAGFRTDEDEATS